MALAANDDGGLVMKQTVKVLCSTVLLVASVFYLSSIPQQAVTSDTSASEILVNDDFNCVHPEGEFCSHLPLVLLETDGQFIQKDEVIWATVKIIDNKHSANHVLDAPSLTTATTLKYRGNSSYSTFDKRQFRLEFYKKAGGSSKRDVAVMGMAKECDWVLYGPFLDRTLVRNKVLYSISRQLMDWAPDTRYCEVFVDGQYQGVYIMTESVKVSESRIKLSDYALQNGETAYLLKRERPGTELSPIRSFGSIAAKTWHELSIGFPTSTRLLDSHIEWIRHDISTFERALYSEYFTDPTRGYAAYIDIDSFVDYYLINEFALIIDAGFLSTYVYKDLGGKLKMAVWDFNNAFDNYPWAPVDVREFAVEDNNWYARLFQDRAFTDKVIARYRELREGILSDSAVLGAIDVAVATLGEAINRNFSVWGYTFFEYLMSFDSEGEWRDPRSYSEAMQQLKDCIVQRGAFLDEHIEALYRHALN